MSNTKDIYEKRVFKNGIIQLELTNHINPARTRTSFERVKHDSTIAEYSEYSESGYLVRTTKYYLDKKGRRCWKDSNYYPNGKLQSVQSYAALRAEELKGFSSDVIPEHTIDSEGYGWQTVPVGVTKTYFQNGKLNTKLTTKKACWFQRDNTSTEEKMANGDIIFSMENFRMCRPTRTTSVLALG
jgi:antitoxin component YwqK of YwqJK toxin-antitoxin module